MCKSWSLHCFSSFENVSEVATYVKYSSFLSRMFRTVVCPISYWTIICWIKLPFSNFLTIFILSSIDNTRFFLLFSRELFIFYFYANRKYLYQCTFWKRLRFVWPRIYDVYTLNACVIVYIREFWLLLFIYTPQCFDSLTALTLVRVWGN